jgi:VWFA-related protein
MIPGPNGMMFTANKKRILLSLLIIGLLSYGLTFLPQEIQHDVSVINIEVPVRVFKGDAFVDNLSIGDFEVYEDGKLQKIEAVYLIKKTDIRKREETRTKFSPAVSRHFVLAFELNEYLPKIDEALNYFFDNIIAPGDTLNVVTPVKTYNFKSEALAKVPKQKITGQLKDKLRNDITLGNSEYRSLMKNLEDLFIFEVEPDLKQLMYLETARKLRDIKFVDQQKLVGFADFLKNMTGQKYVFMFYQKELIPVLPGIDDFYLAELRKDISLDIEKIRQAFSDSSISVHFLFVTNKPGMHDDLNVGRMQPLRVELLDQSDSIFGAFKEVAKATGGIADSSANAAASFQKAAAASENYYLLYYLPKDYKADGKFKEIEVKVKDKNYAVSHRAGYFAN